MNFQNILEAIGNTPHLRLGRLFPKHEVWIKLEKNNPGGSIKDRIALGMIEDAETKGILKPGGTIIEPTSGNTGIGLAMVAAIKGYKMLITMPESMSIERRVQMQAYGAQLVLTPRERGMKGAIAKAEELAKEIKNAWIPQQFENRANPQTHYATTAREIIADFEHGFDYFVAGVGTGGHLSGVGQALKEKFEQMKIVAVEPILSPVLSGGQPAAHPLQGIGAGFVPRNLKTDIVDQIIAVSKEEAFDFVRRAAKEEGLFVGISTGASLAAVSQVLTTARDGAKVITINYDTGERYLSVEGLFV